MNRSTPGLPVHHHLPEFTQLMTIESVMPSSHLILCHPLLLLPPIPPSIRIFSNESTLHMRQTKYWSFSLSIIASKEIPGLISFRMDWSDLLAVQGTLKSLLQHHSLKASVLQCSAFFTVQLSHPYMTTGKTIALTRRTLVSKVMSLLWNMLSRLVITFLPRTSHYWVFIREWSSVVKGDSSSVWLRKLIFHFLPSFCHGDLKISGKWETMFIHSKAEFPGESQHFILLWVDLCWYLWVDHSYRKEGK